MLKIIEGFTRLAISRKVKLCSSFQNRLWWLWKPLWEVPSANKWPHDNSVNVYCPQNTVSSRAWLWKNAVNLTRISKLSLKFYQSNSQISLFSSPEKRGNFCMDRLSRTKYLIKLRIFKLIIIWYAKKCLTLDSFRWRSIVSAGWWYVLGSSALR